MPSVAAPFPSAMTSSASSSARSTPMPTDPPVARTSSYAGQKRSRQADGLELPPRRTKSTGDAKMTKVADDGYKRGMLRSFVRTALDEVKKGNNTHYNELVSHFSTSPSTSPLDFAALIPLVQAISSNVSLLTHLHASLVAALIDVPWATADDRFVRAYITLMGTLASARPEWVGAIVTKAVKGLAWQKRMRIHPDYPPISRRLLYERQHSLIQHLLSLIPTLPTALQPILLSHFPYRKEREVEYVTYIRNVLQVVEYCGDVSGKVWEGVVDRLIRLDVEIQNELEDVDDDEDEDMNATLQDAIAEDPFSSLVSDALDGEVDSDDEGGSDDEIAVEDLSSDDGSDDDDDVEDDAKRQARLKALLEMKAKLDSLMFYFLKHLQRIFVSRPVSPRKGTAPSPAEIAILQQVRLHHFQTLLSIFDRLILPTFQSRRVQFIFFWCCSLDTQYTELFLGLLVSKALFERSPAVVTRIAAASYVSSMVSRAHYVDDVQARKVAGYLLAFIDGELQAARDDPESMAANGNLAVFYAVCQAMMMIFCFRWQAFEHGKEGDGEMGVLGEMEMDDEGDSGQATVHWLPELDVYHKAVFSNLNPLMACYPAVVDMFAKIAHSTNFMFCYSKIEANRLASAAVSGSGSAAQGDPFGSDSMTILPLMARQVLIDSGLESYFPFDPYDLPRSRSYVDAIYRKWDDVPRPAGMPDDVDDEPETTDASEVETDTGTSMPTRSSYLSPNAGFGGSLRAGRSLIDGEMLSSSMDGLRMTSDGRMAARLQVVS